MGWLNKLILLYFKLSFQIGFEGFFYAKLLWEFVLLLAELFYWKLVYLTLKYDKIDFLYDKKKAANLAAFL